MNVFNIFLKYTIVLLSVFVFSSCSERTNIVISEEKDNYLTESNIINSETTMLSNNKINNITEYNGTIILETDVSLIDLDNLTTTQYIHLKFVMENIVSSNKEIMTILSKKKPPEPIENAPKYYANILDIYEYDNQTYLVRSCMLMGGISIFDIWSTDGNTVEYVGDFVTSEYQWMYPIQMGKPVIVTTEFVSRGFDYSTAPVIVSKVYTLENNTLTEYTLSNDKQFFWHYSSQEDDQIKGNRLFILDAVEDTTSVAPDEIIDAVLDNTFKQELAWVDNKIEVISGYGSTSNS